MERRAKNDERQGYAKGARRKRGGPPRSTTAVARRHTMFARSREADGSRVASSLSYARSLASSGAIGHRRHGSSNPEDEAPFSNRRWRRVDGYCFAHYEARRWPGSDGTLVGRRRPAAPPHYDLYGPYHRSITGIASTPAPQIVGAWWRIAAGAASKRRSRNRCGTADRHSRDALFHQAGEWDGHVGIADSDRDPHDLYKAAVDARRWQAAPHAERRFRSRPGRPRRCCATRSRRPRTRTPRVSDPPP